MKILVDEMPQNSAQCLFSWKHIEYSNRMCRLGGFCKMTDGKCERLQTLNGYPIDLRDEYFVRGYERGFKDGSMDERGDNMNHCDECAMKPYCVARLNDRTITGCNILLFYKGLISKEEVVIEHTVKEMADGNHN